MHGRFSKLFLAGVLSLSGAAACSLEGEKPVINNASVLAAPILRVGVSLPGNYLAGRQALKKNEFYQAQEARRFFRKRTMKHLHAELKEIISKFGIEYIFFIMHILLLPITNFHNISFFRNMCFIF